MPASCGGPAQWLLLRSLTGCRGLFSGQGVWGQVGTPHPPLLGHRMGPPLEAQADPTLALQKGCSAWLFCLVVGLVSAPLQARPC